MLCRKILLDRISSEHFSKHIQNAAQKRWKQKLSEQTLIEIISLTECHTYYVNMLCDMLWDGNTIPTIKDIHQCWQRCLFENKGKIIADLEQLNPNRTKVMITIAHMNTINEPNSKEFLNKVKMPLGTVQKSIKYLLDNDYIYETETGLQCVDPLMRKFIIEYILN